MKKLPLLNTLKITKKTGIQVFDKDTSPIYKLYNLKPPHLRHLHFTAAAMLGVLGGEEPTSANIEKVLSSVGVEVDKKNLFQVPVRGFACHRARSKSPTGSELIGSTIVQLVSR